MGWCSHGKQSNIKDKLQDGMVVEMKSGDRYLVVGNRFISKVGYIDISDFEDNLTMLDDHDFDINKIYDEIYFLDALEKNDELRIFWERPLKRKMTLQEIENKLGYEIELI